MAHINLLPWREERRKHLTREFVTRAALSAVLAAAVVFYGNYHVNGLIDHQQARNDYLGKEIEVLQQRLAEIKELESTKEELLARMDIIQQLQTQRPQIVHLFHELAGTLPDGVSLNSVKQTNKTVTISGTAESNARVSAYMRNLDDSGWLTKPKLEIIEANKNERINAFKLHLTQTEPKAEEGSQ